jgi:hypothetical protein
LPPSLNGFVRDRFDPSADISLQPWHYGSAGWKPPVVAGERQHPGPIFGVRANKKYRWFAWCYLIMRVSDALASITRAAALMMICVVREMPMMSPEGC